MWPIIVIPVFMPVTLMYFVPITCSIASQPVSTLNPVVDVPKRCPVGFVDTSSDAACRNRHPR